MSWAERARAYINSIELTLAHPRPDAAEMRRILREAGHRFHSGTSWGLKIWRRESRLHLIRHYDVQPDQPPPPPWQAGLPDDIIFPWKRSAHE